MDSLQGFIDIKSTHLLSGVAGGTIRVSMSGEGILSPFIACLIVLILYWVL